MEAKVYQAFVEQLDALTPVQREALMTALQAQASSQDALTLM